MNTQTNYLGLELNSPLVVAASPLSKSIDNIKKMEEKGAGAVVLNSLFEEQIRQESMELEFGTSRGMESSPEASSYFPDISSFDIGPQEYLDHIRKAKEAVDIPIIASLNGTSLGGWTDYAKKIEDAGADALELNIYSIPTDKTQTASDFEDNVLQIVRSVRKTVNIPLAVKLSPFFSNLSNFVSRLKEEGADGVVLFNRFYQPDIDIEKLGVESNLQLSSQVESRMPLRWVAILSADSKIDFAGNSGIHQADDVIKMLLVGANVTQLCSSLLQNGIEHLETINNDLRSWMEKNDYQSVQQLQGSMNQKHVDDPSAYERAQYMNTIRSYDL